MKEIQLTQGKVARVSDHRYNKVVNFKWRAVWIKDRWYARRSNDDVFLHRFIMGVTDPSVLVDHRDGNGLNCQDENLRVCTPSQNSMNRQNRRNRALPKGVYWSKQDRKYKAQIFVKGNKIHLGYFDDPESASRAYAAAAQKYFGLFAKF
jgi:HNH endonuclease